MNWFKIIKNHMYNNPAHHRGINRTYTRFQLEQTNSMSFFTCLWSHNPTADFWIPKQSCWLMSYPAFPILFSSNFYFVLFRCYLFRCCLFGRENEGNNLFHKNVKKLIFKRNLVKYFFGVRLTFLHFVHAKVNSFADK